MIIDTSALFAILESEPERGAFERALAAAEWAEMAMPSLFELTVALGRRHAAPQDWRIDRAIESYQIGLVAFDRSLLALAREGFHRFGKGRHPARLNICDCFSYALARARGAPLLFKGADFSRTDVAPAWTP